MPIAVCDVVMDRLETAWLTPGANRHRRSGGKVEMRRSPRGRMARDSKVELQTEFVTLDVYAGWYLRTACYSKDTVNPLRRLNLRAAYER